MEEDVMHELAAGYALDALSADDERLFEAHLAHCAQCQDDVAAFSAAAAELGFHARTAPVPAHLRDRIVDAARRERLTALRARPRRTYLLRASAAAAACAAIGLGIWAATLHARLGSAEPLRALGLRGAPGSVVLGRGGAATLVVSGLPTPPAGQTYEIWVRRGAASEPAGLFRPRPTATTVIGLSRPVADGWQVAVTVEPSGGSPRPTGPRVVTSAPA